MQLGELEALLGRILPDLDRRLREKEIRHGPDVWVAIHDLLLGLAHRGQLPDDVGGLAPYLSALLCKSSEQQKEFPALFQACIDQTAEPRFVDLVPGATAGEQIKLASWRQRLRTVERRSWIGLAVLLLVLAGIALWANLQPVPVQQETKKRTETPVAETWKPPPNTDIPIDDWAPPNRLPPPEPLEWRDALAWRHGVAIGIPPSLFLLWLIWFYWGHLMFNKEAADGANLLNKFRFNARREALFGGPHAERTLVDLKTCHWEPTRRIDVPATVEATAHRAGYLTPRYRERRAKPRYVLLVRSQHREDHSAALGGEIYRRFEEAGLDVTAYRFRENPNALVAWDGRERELTSLSRLAAEQADARLVMLSEFDVLFHPLTGEARPWIKQFEHWPRRAWLNPGQADVPVAQWLWSEGFLLLPLRRERLDSLTRWLATGGVPQDAVPTGWSWVPPSIASDRRAWLNPYPPFGASLGKALAELTGFLGPKGLLLLQCVAGYPQPHWNLTQALDFFLFPADQAPERELRLQKLAWLPWMRHAHLPAYLREVLVERLARQDKKRIREVYGELFARLSSGESRRDLVLAIARPEKTPWRKLVRDLFRWRKSPGGLDDPVFASLLLGRTRAFLEFTLPNALQRLLPWMRWRVEPRIVLFALAASLACLAIWGEEESWRRWIAPGFKARWAEQAKRGNAGWTVQVQASGDNQALAEKLRQDLLNQGFHEVTVIAEELGVNAAATREDAELRYPPGALEVVERLRGAVAHLRHGAPPEARNDAGLPGDRLVLRLAQPYQAGSRFRDSLVNAHGSDERATFSVFQDRFLTDLKAPTPSKAGEPSTEAKPPEVRYGPDMVALPGGAFTMGCGGGKDQCPYGDELPPHAVQVKPFALGRYEVTFDEYDAYVESLDRDATKPAQGCEAKPERPKDEGWGRGARPVINVNWNQARCYAAWLAEQTGQPYRLPSEAEFEYALRAGGQSDYPWGDTEAPAGLHAWYSANSGGQTHPAGRKRPNAFGLYDLSGNVWEWVQDCWHANYQGAPGDGAAWEGDKTCDRVVRGGSWDDYPQYLRSAYRGGDSTGVASSIQGFRVARAM